MNQEKIGKFLKELRKQKGLTQERKSRNMDKEMKETVLRAADYTNTEAEHCNRRVRICNGIALLFVLAYIIMKDTSLYNNSTVVIGLDIVQGFAVGMLLVGLLYSSRYGARIRAFKHRLMKKQG